MTEISENEVYEDDAIDAVTLQLEEVYLRKGEPKRKCRGRELPDDEVALDDYESELNNALSSLHDEKMARSIAKAVDEDGEAIRSIHAEEHQDENDRTVAWRPEMDLARVGSCLWSRSILKILIRSGCSRLPGLVTLATPMMAKTLPVRRLHTHSNRKRSLAAFIHV